MNIFIIPSWYPSPSNPIDGIYYKNQTQALAQLMPDSNFGISTWGQGDYSYMIQVKDHYKNLFKLFKKNKFEAHIKELGNNINEYYTPAYTWSRSIFKGNIKKIVKANISNLKKFELKFGKVDIIHAHVSHPGGYIAMLISKELNIPYIITEHMGPFPFKSFLLKDGRLSPYLSEPLKNASKVIAVSPALAERIRTFEIALPIYIPNFVEENIFYPYEKVLSKNKPFTFFTASNIVYDKGILHLLHAIKSIKQDLSNVQFVFAGKGKDLPQFKEYAKKMEINDQITWLGEIPREDMPLEIQQCNAFILPSLHENLPISILEAIACGKPVISTISGGPEFILNAKNGILINPGSVEEIATSILTMIHSYDNYDSKIIRADFMERFSGKKIASDLNNLYKMILESQIRC